MPQLFKPSANTLAKLSVILAGLLPVVVLYAGVTVSRSPYNTKVDIPIDQPIPFSHQHHAYELGIDCRYCHTTVEKTAIAGVPPTETCMSCHSQIWTNSPLLEPVRKSYETGLPIAFADGSPGWTKVNAVPDFVYFDHSIHIDRGINCNVCHGPVNKMQITWKGNDFQMRWCLECHREPEKYLYTDAANPNLSGREQVFNLYMKLQEGAKLTQREYNMLYKNEFRYSPNTKEIEEGKALVKKYGVTKESNVDCYTCHH